MHPRNPYLLAPDFKELALKYPEFRKYAKQKLSGKISIDFKDPAAIRALTTVLLQRDFNLSVEIPPDRLVPTLPLRLNYLLWIEDLLNLGSAPASAEVCGLDIGTGCCCIYPLLGVRKNGWKFTATETEETNYQFALQNVSKNNLSEKITVKKVDQNANLIADIDLHVQYDFCMCNPPFFDNDKKMLKSRTGKRSEAKCPKSGGSNINQEIITEGGEVQFVKRLIEESQKVKSSVRIFTSMLGHKSSIKPLKLAIHSVEAVHWTQTEFIQGKTTRWGIAWTFLDDVRLEQNANQQKVKTKSPLTYVIVEEEWTRHGEYRIDVILEKIIEELKKLDMQLTEKNKTKSSITMEFLAENNTWSHQRRKRRQKQRNCSEIVEDGSMNDNNPDSKKRKLDEEANDPDRKINLKGWLHLQKTGSVIGLQLQWMEGGLGRESTNQIMQYLKNRLFNK